MLEKEQREGASWVRLLRPLPHGRTRLFGDVEGATFFTYSLEWMGKMLSRFTTLYLHGRVTDVSNYWAITCEEGGDSPEERADRKVLRCSAFVEQARHTQSRASPREHQVAFTHIAICMDLFN